ncbi:MAG: ATP-binding cassette domain-containing protein [Betaproteobacteria bacterium]|nr:ATP-binding cassette domain-containing protein [Betaproteobacteria bacterium]
MDLFATFNLSSDPRIDRSLSRSLGALLKWRQVVPGASRTRLIAGLDLDRSPGSRVEDNVLAILETRPELDATQRATRCEQILADLRIEHVRRSPGMALSGGERRRVEIARALAADPRFMLLDEPFAGVDPLSVADIQHIIRELAARGIGILITDHNVRETLDVCARSYIIGDGTVIASGSAAEILANPRVREVYLGESFSL